ncbi:MAG: hypothetical protein PVH00_03035, partial [Gemmatimonadota bacterium]
MRVQCIRRFPLLLAVLPLLATSLPLHGQQAGPETAVRPANGKVLTLDDYPGWKRIQSAGLSPDGRWMTWAYRPNEGDDTLFIRELDGSGLHNIVRGTSPSFSGDSRWVTYTVNPPQGNGGGRGRGGGRGQTPPGGRGQSPAASGEPRRFELLDLRTGTTWEVSDVQSSEFSADAKFLAVRRNPADREASFEGSDLLLRDLSDGSVRNFGNVGAFAFGPAGKRLAWTVDAADHVGNGLYLLDLARGVVTTLDSKAEEYRQLAWNEEGTALAVLRGLKPEKKEQRVNVLVVAQSVDRRPATFTYDPADDATFP